MSGELVDGLNGKLVGGLQREYLWRNITAADVVDIAVNDGYADGHVQIDIQGGTPPNIELAGTDVVDATTGLPTNFLPCKDAGGVAINVTVDSRIQLESLPKYFRPTYAAGTGTVTVLVKARGRG